MYDRFCLSCGSGELERGYDGVYECQECECIIYEEDFEFYEEIYWIKQRFYLKNIKGDRMNESKQL